MWFMENLKTEAEHVYYSRYIASWRNAGGTCYDEWFSEWLRSEGCSEEECRRITEMATCGKFELERSAEKFNTKERRKEFYKNYYDLSDEEADEF